MAATASDNVRDEYELVPADNRQGRWQLFVTPDRIAYVGLLGRPGTRTMGATTFYVALENPFRIWQEGAGTSETMFAIVPAYVPHHIATRDRNFAEVLVESESVEPEAIIAQCAATPGRAEQTANRVLEGFRRARERPPANDGLDFDALFFDAPLRPRKVDPRIAAVIGRINTDPSAKHGAELLAAMTGLSFSRFTHLFCEQTGTTLRSFRAWKRARSVMHFFKCGKTLLDTALEMGYADSTHFSHALRRFYGLSPRDMFAGARGVAVFEQRAPAAETLLGIDSSSMPSGTTREYRI